jgi:Na+/proline symporter
MILLAKNKYTIIKILILVLIPVLFFLKSYSFEKAYSEYLSSEYFLEIHGEMVNFHDRKVLDSFANMPVAYDVLIFLTVSIFISFPSEWRIKKRKRQPSKTQKVFQWGTIYLLIASMFVPIVGLLAFTDLHDNVNQVYDVVKGVAIYLCGISVCIEISYHRKKSTP